MTDPARLLSVQVVYALPDCYWSTTVEMPAGATVAQALVACGLEVQVPGLLIDDRRLAIFGRLVTRKTVVHEGDRVEILRPLALDPKQLRRERAAKPVSRKE